MITSAQRAVTSAIEWSLFWAFVNAVARVEMGESVVDTLVSAPGTVTMPDDVEPRVARNRHEGLGYDPF